MNRELTPQEIIYDFKVTNFNQREDIDSMPEYDQVYEKIKTALEIEKEGYNVYLIDDFSKDKLDKITEFVRKKLEAKDKPQDICYVVDNDEKCPKPLFLPGGKGVELKRTLENIQKLYAERTYEFYNSSSNKEKEEIVESLQKKRSNLINKLVKMAEDDGFTMKATQNGFTFIPLKEEGELMNENDYDDLKCDEKENILNKVGNLKINAQDLLEELKKMELSEIEKIKKLMVQYYNKESKELRNQFLMDFEEDPETLEFLKNVCDNIEKQVMEIYSINYEDDEEYISEIIYKYVVNVLVDNSENDTPPVIFEEDPNINSLLGSMEYENKNGVYTTDVSLIKGGSFLKANGGCLILRVSSLLTNSSAYYYFKKSLISGKVDLDYNRGYLELLSLSGLKPEPVKFDAKIILIGDYHTYDLLYSYDEDFKKIFKIRAEYKSTLDINKETKQSFLGKLSSICSDNGVQSLTDDAVKELAKFLSRKAEDKNKLYIDEYELERVLMLSNNRVQRENRKFIEGQDIIDTAYYEELIEKEIDESYRENRIFINVKDKLIGQVNGLSVIDTGYFSFGKPIRITCSCYKGNGNIIDVQKESDLSGKIHNKAINTLRGFMNTLLGGYERLPVDFHLSFEQLYGKIDGDSASVAEIISMMSSLSKIGVKQNIAVTGSINQFGEVQPIGGVNEKIEGFFKICKLVDTIKDKGVLIPESNVNSLVLNQEVEEEITKGNFHIYSMSHIKDAVEILMGENELGYSYVMDEILKESKKYADKSESKRGGKTSK
ncbi:AAA family ATPase [Clostridium magnum]|uniref:endopeptidase La n=1 Tax=Clostridium magnum DSM 2767 TaxID=1121326 RepID=A0A162UQ03_9CLOT|nr:AAA family ATPase [Clostridium magnum]KZL94165.1 Lon protease [Clostridium magnum DSM 2767]SHH93850.1 Predicted ATP-dependent protease [Clostridium magnum DSM 2767]